MLVLLLVGSIVALSWKPSPKLVKIPFLPRHLLRWADKSENGNIRTAVPFIGLGICAGALLVAYKARRGQYIRVCVYCLAFLFLVEGVQYFLPYRHADMGDIGWGFAGFMVGLIPASLVLGFLFRKEN